jgi:hypothetical protein
MEQSIDIFLRLVSIILNRQAQEYLWVMKLMSDGIVH